MTDTEAKITELFASISNEKIEQFVRLPQSGSDRIYYRIFTSSYTFIATLNINVQENKTFIAFTNHFLKKGLPVPQVYAFNDGNTLYIQQDAGTKSLLDNLNEYGYSNAVYSMFQKKFGTIGKATDTW